MSYQGPPPPPQGPPPPPYQGGPPPYQGGPGGPYQGGPGGPYQGGPGGPYQGGPGGPYQGGPASAGIYSDWIHRVGAYLLDSAPVVGIVIVGLILALIIPKIGFLFYLVFWLGALVYSAYNRWVLGGQGQSFGKKTLKMRLVSEETGQPIGTLNAFLRDVCHILDGFCAIGYIIAAFDPKVQTFGDKIMKTVVIPA